MNPNRRNNHSFVKFTQAKMHHLQSASLKEEKLKSSAVFLVGVFAVLSTFVTAQEAEKKAPEWGWQKEATASVNLTQSSFDNYAQGGENSTAWQARLGLKFTNDQEKFNWANTGKFEYGRNKTGDEDSRKSVDELKMESVLSLKIAKYLNPYASVTAESQFASGFNYGQDPKIEISNFFDPGYIREGIGIGYKPNDIIQARLGAAMKQTIANEYTNYSDDPETTDIETLKNEFGAESVIDLNYKITETSVLKSKVELFSNLMTFDEIDVIWDTDLTAKITKFIAFNFNVKLVYDKDISAKRQLKQVMGIGLSYSFL
jgi:hypothetical protein